MDGTVAPSSHLHLLARHAQVDPPDSRVMREIADILRERAVRCA